MEALASSLNNHPAPVRKGDVLERDGWKCIVLDTNSTGHAYVAFQPSVGGFPRPNEWIQPKDWNRV